MIEKGAPLVIRSQLIARQPNLYGSDIPVPVKPVRMFPLPALSRIRQRAMARTRHDG